MGAFKLYNVGSPYAEEHLFDIDVEQSTDTLYMAHLDVNPYKLVRADHEDLDREDDGGHWCFENGSHRPSAGAGHHETPQLEVQAHNPAHVGAKCGSG